MKHLCQWLCLKGWDRHNHPSFIMSCLKELEVWSLPASVCRLEVLLSCHECMDATKFSNFFLITETKCKHKKHTQTGMHVSRQLHMNTKTHIQSYFYNRIVILRGIFTVHGQEIIGSYSPSQSCTICRFKCSL